MGYLFALFVNAGIIKSLFGNYFVLDITIISFVLTLIALISGLLLNKRKIRFVFKHHRDRLTILVFTLFMVCILLSALYTQSPEYWKEKLLRVLFLTIPSFLIPCFFFKLSDIKNFIIGSIIIYCIVILSLVHLLSIYGANLFYIWVEVGLDYLVWGGFIAYNSLLFAGLLLDKRLSKRKMFIKSEWKAIFLSLVSLFVIFLLGARGPFLFFLMAIVGMLLVGKHWKLVISIILCTLLIATVFVFVEDSYEKAASLGRAVRLLYVIKEPSSIQKRIEYYKESWNLIKERPILGYGIGSFSYITGDGDRRGYPHNILLEIWVESGLCATIMFSAFLLFNLYMAIKRIDKVFVRSFLWVSIYFVLSLMKSSSLTDARVFFAYFGILFAATWCSQSESSIIRCHKKLP